MDENKQDKADLSSAGETSRRNAPTIELTASDVSDTATPVDSADLPKDDTQAKVDSDLSSESDASAGPADAKPPSRAGSLVASAMTGAVAAVLVIGAAKLANWPPAPVAPVAPVLTNAATKPDVDALGARLAKIETEVGKPVAPPQPVADPAVTARLGALEKALSALREDVAAARAQGEKAAAALNDVRSAPPPPSADDPKLRNVAAVTLLDSAVRQGEPYAAALAIVRASADDAAALKPLDQFAESGIPTASALCRELLALLPKLAPKPETAAAPSGMVERLQQSAAKLVRIQRTDAAASGNAGILARVTAAAQRDNVAEAKRELMTLPAADRAPAQAWIAKADAREAALAASRQFASDTMTSLSKPAR